MKKTLLLISFLVLSQSFFGQEFIQQWKKHINDGKKLYLNEKYSSAIYEFKKAAEIIPTDTLAFNFVISCAQFTKQAKEAFWAINKLEKLNFNSPKSYHACIPILIENNFSAENIFTLFNSAIKKFPNDKKLQFQALQFYLKYNLTDLFLEKIKPYLIINPYDYDAYLLLINVLNEQVDDSTMGLNTIKKAQQRFPDSLSFYKMEYSHYLKNNNFDKAQNLIENLLKKHTKDPELYYNLALLYFEQEEYEESANICKKAIELNPDYVEAIYNIGTFYYYQGMMYNSALSDMTVDQYKEQGKDFQDLAHQYFREAKPYFEKATKLNSTDLDAYENLNTISILIENIESNQSLDYDWSAEISQSLPLSLSDININYENSSNTLIDNSKASLFFKVSNLSDSLLTNIDILINQPITSEGLSFNNSLKIESLNAGDTIQMKLVLNYNQKGGNVTSIEEAEGAQDKLRLYAKSNKQKISDLQEISLDISRNQNTNISSVTENLNFEANDVSNNFLITIGINDYLHWPPLNNAVFDAMLFKNELIKNYGFKPKHVYELINTEATHKGLINVLIKIKREISKNDNLIIYYAGHGFYDEELDDGSWIPYDAKEGNKSEYIGSTLLVKYLSNIPSKHTVIIADACFSGSLFIQDQNHKYESNNDKLGSRWGFSSGNMEFVADASVGLGSPFANSLLNFLRNNTKSNLPISEVIKSVSKEIKSTTNQIPIGKPLAIPGNNGGEFVFYKTLLH